MFDFPYPPRNIPKGVFLLPLTLLLVIVLLLPLIRNINQSSSKIFTNSLETKETTRCNIFSGNWSTTYPKEPYYSNETCPFRTEKQNCFMHGRPDREFLKWRWKPHECELPLFDASHFMKLVRGKSMAFVGDSIGRNQAESLLCLINNVAHPEDVTTKYTSTKDNFFKWWFSAEYNFTVTMLWSPFLVKSVDADLNASSFYRATKLYLDEADGVWANIIEKFDYAIFSTGQWFFRPFMFYENREVVGCQICEKNMTELNLYGYRKAFKTAFKTVRDFNRFKGLTFLVTHSPDHFENGMWNEGGTCNRTRPFTMEERGVYKNGDMLKTLNQIQVEEFNAAEKEARKKGLRFGLIDISDVMAMRPDGHPNRYGKVVDKNVTINDCVHWCMPGPIDTWIEFLLYVMKQLEGASGNTL